MLRRLRNLARLKRQAGSAKPLLPTVALADDDEGFAYIGTGDAPPPWTRTLPFTPEQTQYIASVLATLPDSPLLHWELVLHFTLSFIQLSAEFDTAAFIESASDRDARSVSVNG